MWTGTNPNCTKGQIELQQLFNIKSSFQVDNYARVSKLDCSGTFGNL